VTTDSVSRVAAAVCGRFTNTAERSELAERFRVSLPDSVRRRYNVAPAQSVVVVRRSEADRSREAALVRWGLVPHWAKDEKIAFKLFNARAETLAEKPAFRGLLARRRCLVPADGFYEWRVGADGRKEPVRFTLARGELFAFAGLWTGWTDPSTGEPLQSCTIVTTAPNRLVATVHDRMPVILDPGAEEEWLDPDISIEHAVSLLTPYPAQAMAAQAASRRVGSVRNDDAGLLLADREPAAA
jgi:putative SOS response-associated peptidase YedK